jgi:hypothetical protein
MLTRGRGGGLGAAPTGVTGTGVTGTGVTGTGGTVAGLAVLCAAFPGCDDTASAELHPAIAQTKASALAACTVGLRMLTYMRMPYFTAAGPSVAARKDQAGFSRLPSRLFAGMTKT